MHNHVFFGTGGLLSSICLKTLILNAVAPSYVVIQHQAQTPYPNLTQELCEIYAIPFELVETVHSAALVRKLSGLKPHFGVVASFGEIFKREILQLFPIFNVHMGVLPYYRGAYTNFWKILNNDDVYGVTIHRMDEKVDGGQSILIIEKNFQQAIFANDFFIQNYEMAANAIVDVINGYYANQLTYTPIDISKGKYYRKFNQQDMVLYPHENIISLHKKINRLQFYGHPTLEGFSLTESNILLNSNLQCTDFLIKKVNEKSFVLKNKTGLLLLKHE